MEMFQENTKTCRAVVALTACGAVNWSGSSSVVRKESRAYVETSTVEMHSQFQHSFSILEQKNITKSVESLMPWNTAEWTNTGQITSVRRDVWWQTVFKQTP